MTQARNKNNREQPDRYGLTPSLAEAFGTRVTEIESRYPRRLPPLLGGNAPDERYRPNFGTGALHACPELIGLPTSRFFFGNIPIPSQSRQFEQTDPAQIGDRSRANSRDDRQNRDQRTSNGHNSDRFRTTYRDRNREYSGARSNATRAGRQPTAEISPQALYRSPASF